MRTIFAAPLLAALTLSSSTLAQTPPDGQHDFDFEIGRWHVTLKRLLKPLTGSTTWTTLEGTSVVRPVWNGLANLGELEVDGSGTHVQGISFRVYDPKARQWRIHWANSADGLLGPAMIGGFRDGRGEFYDQEDFNGRAILVRFIFSDITKTSFRIEQAFSDDGGASWETNWITTFTRDVDQAEPTQPRLASDRPPDFDFEVGTWSMHTRRLEDPLGGTTWIDDSGATHIVRPVWGGKAALGELRLPAAPPTFAGSLLRTYDPRSKQWRLYWADRESGRVAAPMVGTFSAGRASFYGQQDMRGITVLTRLTFDSVSANAFRTEQSYSRDGGAHWTAYAVTTFTRRSP